MTDNSRAHKYAASLCERLTGLTIKCNKLGKLHGYCLVDGFGEIVADGLDGKGLHAFLRGVDYERNDCRWHDARAGRSDGASE